ncbi:MAG: hypothetical protein HQ536_05390 [Parcubacteria group bacterium]|nr:hypothetical protein [Parcubacteria group bacterium]
MIKTAKTPVFFIATKVREEPAVVNFYTKRGRRVSFDTVKKVKTKEGVNFYASSPSKR